MTELAIELANRKASMIVRACMYHNGLRSDIKILKTIKIEYLVHIAISEAQEKMYEIRCTVLKDLSKN